LKLNPSLVREMAGAEQSTMDNTYHQHLRRHTNGTIAPKRITIDISASMNDKSRSSINSTVVGKGRLNIIRKRLGSQRSLQDMISPEEQQFIKNSEDMRQDNILGRHQQSLQPTRSLRELKSRRRLVFTSPRVISSDEDLFPSNYSLYKESSDRWRQISEQAGSHRQDGTVMNIGRRPSTAFAFRMGIIGCAAVRVRSLNLWLDHEKDTLPDWLKMVRDVFLNLEHLIITEDTFPGENDMAVVSARMRRLYVLSILPNLKSIDDVVVTSKEREMANPGGYSDQFKSNRDECSESIDSNDDPVSIDTVSIGSSRVNGIEVEFLAAMFQDTNHAEIKTNADISAKTKSKIRTTAADADDHIVLEKEDKMVGVALLNDTIDIPPIPSIDRKFDTSHKNENCTDTETRERFELTKDSDIDLTYRFNNSSMEGHSTISMKHDQSAFCNVVLRNNNCHFDDEMKKKGTRARVRALHSDSTNNIELVSVASNDLEWSAACDFSNFLRTKICAPSIQLPFSAGDTKTMAVSPKSYNQSCRESASSLRNKEREKENSNIEACTAKACTPVQRQSKIIVSTPQVGCCMILKKDRCSKSKFSFPSVGRLVSTKTHFSEEKLSDFGVSTNQQVPSLKSLSSQFPMQFRERQKPSRITTTRHLVVKTYNSIDCDSRRVQSRRESSMQSETETINPLSVTTSLISYPKTVDGTLKTAQKGELPPSCPFGKIRCKAVADNKFMERKPRRRNQRHLNNVLNANARSTSVLDLDEGEEGFDTFI